MNCTNSSLGMGPAAHQATWQRGGANGPMTWSIIGYINHMKWLYMNINPYSMFNYIPRMVAHINDDKQWLLIHIQTLWQMNDDEFWYVTMNVFGTVWQCFISIYLAAEILDVTMLIVMLPQRWAFGKLSVANGPWQLCACCALVRNQNSRE